MREILMALAVVAGAGMPIQAGINAQLRHHAGSPVLASLISFAVGTLALVAVYFGVLRGPLPGWDAWSKTAWWMWLGGPLGTLFVLASVIITPRLGAATMMVLVIAGQLSMALLVDRFGLIGLPLRDVGAMRLLGLGLVLVGVVLITRY